MGSWAFDRDTIDLLVSAAIIGSQLPAGTPPDTIRGLVRTADEVGKALWAANINAVNHAYGLDLPAPDYEWLPIAALMGHKLTDAQALQIERSRQELLDQSRSHPDWDGSLAANFLEKLGAGLAQRLQAWPSTPSDVDLGVLEYAGIRTGTVAAWSRDHGFPEVHLPATGSKAA